MSDYSPKYLKVYNDLKQDIIENKRYLPGSFLPPEDKLCEIYGASRTTVRHAVSLLKKDGLLSVKQGSGTCVLSDAASDSPLSYYKYSMYSSTQVSAKFETDSSAQIKISTPAVDIVNADANISGHLCVALNSPVFRMQRLHYVNDSPFAYWCSYFRMDITPELDTRISQNASPDLSFLLEEQYDIHAIGAEEIFSAVKSGFQEATFLGIPIGDPVLRMERTFYSNKGISEFAVTDFRADLYHIVVTLKEKSVPDQLAHEILFQKTE